MVSNALSIVRADDPDAVRQPIVDLLTRFNREAVGAGDRRVFALTIEAPGSGEIVGGLWAYANWGSFYVNFIVVPEAARGTGLGSEMMRQAEQEARALGCSNIWLDTFAFQARPFYERLGFEVFGRLDGLAPYYPRYFMRKMLDGTGGDNNGVPSPLAGEGVSEADG
jgi:GNAT superfamily N-acetyltransferase